MLHSRRLLAALTLACGLSAVTFAATTIFTQVIVDNTVGGVRIPVIVTDPPGAPQMQTATCRVRSAEISFTYDGTPPTITVGTLAGVGDVLYLPDHDKLLQFRAIRTTGANGQLDCNVTRQ